MSEHLRWKQTQSNGVGQSGQVEDKRGLTWECEGQGKSYPAHVPNVEAEES